jgi:hypothetical protein
MEVGLLAYPDIITVMVTIGNVSTILIATLRIYITRSIIRKKKSELVDESRETMVNIVDRTWKDNYSVNLIPMMFLLGYLVLYVARGIPPFEVSWEINSPESILSLVFLFMLFVLTPFLFTLNHTNEFFVVSNQAVERHKGSRVKETIRWDDITYISTNLGQQLDDGDILKIVMSSNQKKMVIDTYMSGIEMFCKLAVEKIPEPLRQLRTYHWMMWRANHQDV